MSDRNRLAFEKSEKKLNKKKIRIKKKEALKIELLGRFEAIAAAAGLRLTLCCQPELREALGWERSCCNGWDWATRVHPQLKGQRALKDRPSRPDCGCSNLRGDPSNRSRHRHSPKPKGPRPCQDKRGPSNLNAANYALHSTP